MAFNPSSHLIQLKSKQGPQDYLPVKWRLVWFREQCPQGTIDTEELAVDLDREVTVETYAWNPDTRRTELVQKTGKGYARYKAVITDGNGARATGTGSECAADFADFVEKAETKAIGRALAALGYGTQFTGDEFNEGERIVDSPIEPENPPKRMPQPPTKANGATPDQVRAIYGYSKALGLPVDPSYVNGMAAAAISQYISELKTKYQALKAQEQPA